jgi:hypothetical protein
MKEKTMPSEFDVLLERLDSQDAEIQRLKALVEPTTNGTEAPARSRRDLLKLAGAAVVGAAGAAALKVMPASAANGDAVTVGGNFTGTATTQITSTAGNAIQGNGNATGGAGLVGTSSNTDGFGVVGASYGSGGVGGTFYGIAAPIHLERGAAGGAPTTEAHRVGDIWMDLNGIVWSCTADGTPGSWLPLTTGGENFSHFTKVAHQQYSLLSSNGATWVDMDTANLSLTITPGFAALAVISVSADLWTANAGYNQDIGIFISGGDYGAGKIVAWKESGGFAGTFSPNAAFVETSQPLVAGTAYTIKVRWKTNKPATGKTIFAGAGPLPAGSAGGGTVGEISPTRLATHLVVDVPLPAVLHIPTNDPTKAPAPIKLPQR